MQTLYHMQTYRQRRTSIIKAVLVVIGVCVVVVAVLFAYQVSHESALEQGASSVRQTVLDTAMQCAAIEGSYPSELSYLETNYGLSINHNDYIVTYDCFASNVVPSVTVVKR